MLISLGFSIFSNCFQYFPDFQYFHRFSRSTEEDFESYRNAIQDHEKDQAEDTDEEEQEERAGKRGPPKTLKKPIILLKTNTYGLNKILINIKLRCMPNSDPWGPPGTRVMTIFGFYVGRHFPNIQYFDVYKGI